MSKDKIIADFKSYLFSTDNLSSYSFVVFNAFLRITLRNNWRRFMDLIPDLFETQNDKHKDQTKRNYEENKNKLCGL